MCDCYHQDERDESTSVGCLLVIVLFFLLVIMVIDAVA